VKIGRTVLRKQTHKLSNGDENITSWRRWTLAP